MRTGLLIRFAVMSVATLCSSLFDSVAVAQRSSGGLGVATYNLMPKTPIRENREQARQLADSTITVIKTLLYSRSGEAAAAAQGRRLWYDPNTLQVTITDTPENLRLVGGYIRSLATTGAPRHKSEIVYLKHQNASDVQGLLERVTGAGAGGAAATGQQSVTKTLRTEGELLFRDLRIRVVRIEQGDVNDDNDDSVTMIVRTGTTSEDRTIQEFRSDFIDDYEINVIEVRPSNSPGEGSARIEVRYSPATLRGAPAGTAVVPVR